METTQIESGVQLLQRLNQRQSLTGLYPCLLDDGPLPNDIIEITGNSGIAKHLLILELLGRCLLPTQYNNITLPGKNCGAVIIDCNHHFDMFQLIKIMELILKHHIQSKTVISKIVKASLENLIIMNCYDSHQFCMSFYNLEKLLTDNVNVSLVVIDSISSYYWEYRNKHGSISWKNYNKKLLSMIENLIRNTNIILAFTKTTKDSITEKPNDYVTCSISLNEIDDTYQARISNKNSEKTITFLIEEKIQFVSS